MATTDHPTDGAHGRHEHGNGFDPYSEWLNIPKDHRPCSYYELLGITNGADESTIAMAVHARRDLLAREQKEDPKHAHLAGHILDEVNAAAEVLLTTEKRGKYDEKLSRLGNGNGNGKNVNSETSATHDTIAELTPAVVRRPTKPLAGIAERIKRHPWITAAAAGIAATVGGVLANKSSIPDKQPTVSAERMLPPNTPELTQPQPVTKEPAVPAEPVDIVEPEPQVIPQQEEPTLPPLFQPESPAEPQIRPEPADVTPVTPESKEAAPIEPSPPKRRAQPTDEELAPYNDLFRSPTLRKQSVEQLLEQIQRTEKPVEQWVLLQVALEKARGENNLGTVMTVLAEMQRLFDVDDSMIGQAIAAVQEAAKQKGGNIEQVMTHASGVARSLCAQDDFDGAKRFLASLRRSPSADTEECADMLRLVTQLEKTFASQGIAAHRQTLASNPDDPEANGAVGAYRCLEQGDWSFSTALQTQKGSVLGNLAARVDQSDTLPATDLYQLAQDLVSADMAGPGAVAMAVHCLELAEPKSDSAILTARVKDMKRRLLHEHSGDLGFFRGAPMRPPVEVAQTEPPDVRVDVPNILPPGAVDLLGEDLEALIKKGFVARERWQVKNKEGQLKLLQGSSGTHAWVAAINLPLSAESQKVIQSGQYAFRFVFKRTANGRWPDGMQGVTAFAVPLPNGRSISLYWDGNMDKKAAGAYRSGFDLEGTSFFSSQRRDTAAFGDHQQPVITEDGREYMCLVTVRVVPGGMAIDAQIAGNGDSKPLAHVSLAAPPTVSGDPLLFENKEKKRMPAQAGAPWALGVGGGSVELLDGHVIPLQKNGRKR